MTQPPTPPPTQQPLDLVVRDALLVATMDNQRRELPGGWVGIRDGLVAALGPGSQPPPPASQTISAEHCLVTPGLVNTHHHLFQNLTRAYQPMTSAPLFGWLQALYPLWRQLDEEAAYLSAWVGLAELALGGCTTSTDHLYLHPSGAGDLITATIEAASEVGIRFHPTHGSMSLSQKDGGLPPDDVVGDDDDILAESARLVALHHDPAPGAMVQVALAPCSPFSVSPELMVRTAELAEALDVRLHTHLAENAEDDAFSLERFGRRPVEQFAEVGWLSDRAWVAHCVRPDQAEIERLGAAGVSVAHCPSSNLILASGVAPVTAMRAAGVAVGIGCDGSSSADAASLWQEARLALLLAKSQSGAGAMTARDALEMATRGGARCLGREGALGELSIGATGDLVAWRLDGVPFAGAISDPIEALLRCGPAAAELTVVAGQVVVESGRLVSPDLADRLRRHRRAAERVQQLPAC
jgi:cytosine/adenosine deaminase-related metal-dependent hydrolase